MALLSDWINNSGVESSPAAVCKHEEEHADDDAGHSNVDANHYASYRALSILPAVTHALPSCSHTHMRTQKKKKKKDHLFSSARAV